MNNVTIKLSEDYILWVKYQLSGFTGLAVEDITEQMVNNFIKDVLYQHKQSWKDLQQG